MEKPHISPEKGQWRCESDGLTAISMSPAEAFDLWKQMGRKEAARQLTIAGRLMDKVPVPRNGRQVL